MISLSVVDVSPAANPDKIVLQAKFSGVYGTNLIGDILDLAPYDVVNNPNGFTNPRNLPLPSLPSGLEQAPAINGENIGGYYIQITPLVPAAGATNGVQNTVAAKTGFGMRMFAPGGTELGTGASYAASVLAGNVLIELQLPHDQ